MNLADKLIQLRILLGELCDGFLLEDKCKASHLSTKEKILFLLKERDLQPSEIIKKVCIAKSNLCSMLKTMIKDDLVISYKNMDNSKNIYYRITETGLKELKVYIDSLSNRLEKQALPDQLKSDLDVVLQKISHKLD